MVEAATFRIRQVAKGLFAVEGVFGGLELDYFDSSPLDQPDEDQDNKPQRSFVTKDEPPQRPGNT